MRRLEKGKSKLEKTQILCRQLSRRHQRSTRAKLLPDTFSPGNWDIKCHHGRDPRDHVGNRRFKACVDAYLDSYLSASTRSGKTGIITDIVASIQASSRESGGIGFVRYDSSFERWYEVDNKVARDKVGHSLREAMKSQEAGTEQDASRLSNAKTKFWAKNTNSETIVFSLGQTMHYDTNYDDELSFEGDEERWATSTKDLCDWFEEDMNVMERHMVKTS